MRIIVTGGRGYQDRLAVELALIEAVQGSTSRPTIVHGGATGADSLARDVARALGWDTHVIVPDWKAHGRAAGPMRNQEMVDSGAELCIAFPGGRGTADMVRRARAAGIPVREVQP